MPTPKRGYSTLLKLINKDIIETASDSLPVQSIPHFIIIQIHIYPKVAKRKIN